MCPSGYPSGFDLRRPGPAGRNARTAGKNDGQTRAVARLDCGDESEVHDVRSMYANEPRRFEARGEVLQPRMQQVAAAVSIQRHVVVAGFQPFDTVEGYSKHAATLLDEDVRQRPRRGEDVRPRGDSGHAVLDGGPRPRQHGVHALAAERLQEVVER